MRTTLLRYLRNLRRGEKLKFNRKLITLAVCISISSVFWLLNAYSKVYNAVFSYPVTYVNLPADRVLVNKLPDRISLMLRAQGFLLLVEKFRGADDTVEIDVSGLNIYRRGDVYAGVYSTHDRMDQITRQFAPEISLLKIVPDTIGFAFARKSTKSIPIKINHRLEFEKQHQLRDKIIYEPASVRVTGPAFVLDTLRYIYSDSLVLENLSQNTLTKVALRVPDDVTSLTLNPPFVDVTVPVERFTEATVSVNVEKVNIPPGFSARLIPEKVEVVYLVPFSKFDEVTSRSFSAKVDFSRYESMKRLPVDIVSQPIYVKVVRVEPSKIEYILRRK